MQRDCALRIAGRGRLTSFSVEYKTCNQRSLARAECQIEAQEIHPGIGLRCMPVVSCSFEHHVGDSTIWLGSIPILRENIRRWSEASQLSSPFTNLMRELAARWLFREPPCHKGTIHLQTSTLSPEFEPMPYDAAVSVTNYYIRWVAKYMYISFLN
ncbi:hypothetical protein TNCV_725671 [Trichonephila clavipes]|nr:hypothetical protein TNCV_725671 [Trichonephila clavipes]